MICDGYEIHFLLKNIPHVLSCYDSQDGLESSKTTSNYLLGFRLKLWFYILLNIFYVLVIFDSK